LYTEDLHRRDPNHSDFTAVDLAHGRRTHCSKRQGIAAASQIEVVDPNTAFFSRPAGLMEFREKVPDYRNRPNEHNENGHPRRKTRVAEVAIIEPNGRRCEA